MVDTSDSAPPRDGAATLVAENQRVPVSLVWDPTQSRQAMAHGGGYAFSYVGRLDDGPAKAAIFAAAHALANTAQETGFSGAMRTIVEALPPGAKAVQVRSWLGGQQVPRWPAHLRSANPGQPPSPALWPMDP